MAKENFLKSEFLNAIKEAGTAATLKEAEAQYEAVFNIVKSAADAGKQIQLPFSLGIIEKTVLPAGTAKVPGTDQEVAVPARSKYKLRSKPTKIEG